MKSKELYIVRPVLFKAVKDVVCGVSSLLGGVSPEPLGLNLSFNVGDDPQNVNENRGRFFENLGIQGDAIVVPTQVHGENICYVEAPGQVASCDALFTNVNGVFLTVSIADCVPIFLLDPVTGSVAVVHSGWRGSKLSILQKTIEALQNKFGTREENILAYIGPAASVCCYEVGEEVAREFEELYLLRQQGKNPHLDLKKYNRDLLLKKGVPETNIEVSPYCTICTPGLFHSYRRNKEKSGRMMGVIGITGGR